MATTEFISRPQSAWYLTTGIALAPKGMRAQMAAEWIKFYSFLALLMMLAGLRLNPWDDDFGKMKSRVPWAFDYNIDILAGMDAPLQWLFGIGLGTIQQLGAMSRGEDSDALTDMLSKLFNKFWFNTDAGKKEGWLSGLRFWRGKSSPAVSFGFDYFSGKDFIGREFSWKNAVLSRSVPLAYQQTYESLYYDRYASVMKEPTAAVSPDADIANGLVMLLGTGSGIGLNRYPNEDSSIAEDLAWQFYEPESYKNKKTVEQKRAEIGLRNLFRMRKAAVGEGKSPDEIDTAIAKYAKLYEIPAPLLTKLRQQGEDGKFEFVTKKFDSKQVGKLLKAAMPNERVELEKILESKLASEGKAEKKKETPEKPLANRLYVADVEESVKLYYENSASFTPQQMLEFKRKLREKAMNSNARRQLSRENYDAVRKILGNFPPHLDPRKTTKPIRGLDSLKQTY